MKNNIDLILFNVRASLEDDTKRNHIGNIWLLLEPALSALVYYLVFGLLLRHKEENYVQFLFVGIITWKWYAGSVQSGSSSIHANRGLFKKVYLPKIVFPWIVVLTHTAKFLVVLLAVLIVYGCMGFPITRNHLYLPIFIICQFTFTMGLTTLFAAAVPYYLDLQKIIAFILRLGFYPSGVLFNLDRVPDQYRYLVDFNPMAQSLQAIRGIVIFGKPPSLAGLGLLFGFGLIFYIIGYYWINRLDREYAKIGT